MKIEFSKLVDETSVQGGCKSVRLDASYSHCGLLPNTPLTPEQITKHVAALQAGVDKITIVDDLRVGFIPVQKDKTAQGFIFERPIGFIRDSNDSALEWLKNYFKADTDQLDGSGYAVRKIEYRIL